MCGLTGFWAPAGFSFLDAEVIANAMALAIAHRGPDDFGVWVDAGAGIALAHRRLAIVDLSSAGHQPMVSKSGRFVLVFNGEIYNHLALRKELGDVCAWRGHSDTETLLAGFKAWGIQETVKRAIGMFAFAVWDKANRTLTLGRDRLGEKPLYYGWQGGSFLFGSELKALKTHPAFCSEIDRNALTMLLRHNYIPAPYSIYQGIQKLLPGSLLTVSASDRNALPRPYWSVRQIVADGLVQPFTGSPCAAVDTLDTLLLDAVAQQMMADVPLGAFLSGGVDSSTIVALMQAQSSRPVKSFTIGFHEKGYNEAVHAKAVARHLGTDHTELYVTSQQAMDVIPLLPRMYDEPFSDSSQIPTFLVSQMTRQHVTVSLSGDGGDELFGGYNRYFRAARIWQMLKLFHGPGGHCLSRAMQAVSVSSWDRITMPLKPFLPVKMRNVGDKAHKLAEILAARTPAEIYQGLVSHWRHPSEVVIGAFEPDMALTSATTWFDLADFESCMMYLDSVSYLPDDILVKVDRAAMVNSLETRVPMLDHRVVEFAWRLPLSMKIYESQGKWILRQVLYKYVPKELIERPKMGFGIPLDSWLRGPLRDWAESLLDVTRLKQEGYFNPAPIRQKWEEHLSGKRNWQYHLWDVLMFQAWLESR